MSTLLLRLRAPMQSWGISAKFDHRSTERVPSKSGIIGMIAAALGRKRSESVDDLRTLRFGIRVDAEGSLMRDYQTAKSKVSAYVTHRYYLADAAFLVGLEGDNTMLKAIDKAIQNPVYPMYLGRRSCPPEGRVTLGIVDKALEEALKTAPWIVDHAAENSAQIIIDAGDDERESYILRDNPVSFSQVQRKFAFRRVCDKRRPVSPENQKSLSTEKILQTEHDAFASEFGEDIVTVTHHEED